MRAVLEEGKKKMLKDFDGRVICQRGDQGRGGEKAE